MVLTSVRQLFLLSFHFEPCLKPSHLGRVEADQPCSKTNPARKEPTDINLEKIDKTAASNNMTI